MKGNISECFAIYEKYIDYVNSQIEAGLMPSTFDTWEFHERKCNTGDCEND